ncbi:XRE family transcriptional regulator [Paenibacillus chitinolyticus]|uniref:Helix-turn-helix transcriptional regulator n=1 Tax=Paenibacillus chitinolyticus TaxID=79263 RepID=A0A410WT74_9BACL|nr:helix-turn-helix transcriptional regulator [Paenibacillus chitinolyticus]MCY9588646.1 helix-turn-helix transcriptional regulator [Paenibacillus chitinolyticus]MCY9595850.1 helix-turn-helix transcriptional regulator [Paenibacillus chitinolyticus]QAV17599.1 XRE family transcriptional regulator [Paenibacillus chitinolyticus]
MVIVKPCLNKLLAERNLKQIDLATMTGISAPVLSRFDKNTQHVDNHLFTIAKALKVKIDDLFEIVDNDDLFETVENNEGMLKVDINEN